MSHHIVEVKELQHVYPDGTEALRQSLEKERREYASALRSIVRSCSRRSAKWRGKLEIGAQ